LTVLAVAGLYALPMTSAESCPTEDAWGCTGSYETRADVPEDDQDEIPPRSETEGAVEPELTIGSDEIRIGRSATDLDDVWDYEIFTRTKWIFSDAVAATNNVAVAVAYDGERTWEGAPRVMQPNEARLQILDPRGRDVVLDVELPRKISSLEWTSDIRLLITDADGAIAVFEAESSTADD